MRTQLLYPLNQPLDVNDSKFLYLTALKSANKKQIQDLIGKFHVYIDTEIPIYRNAKLTMSLQVLRLLDKNTGNPIMKYKVMYSEIGNDLRIRADNGHPFPHIDLELPNKTSEKVVFDTDPTDYEASVNVVLRYAERHSNPLVGVDYWLNNLASFRMNEIYFLFRTHQRSLNTITAFTDVARLVSVEILTRKDPYVYNFHDYNQLIGSNFVRCWNYERINHRPLKLSKSLIPHEVNQNLFPFPIIMHSEDLPLKPRVFDIRGNELPSENVRLLGKTTEENDD